jgi:hypothetical protein
MPLPAGRSAVIRALEGWAGVELIDTPSTRPMPPGWRVFVVTARDDAAAWRRLAPAPTGRADQPQPAIPPPAWAVAGFPALAAARRTNWVQLGCVASDSYQTCGVDAFWRRVQFCCAAATPPPGQLLPPGSDLPALARPPGYDKRPMPKIDASMATYLRHDGGAGWQTSGLARSCAVPGAFKCAALQSR